MHRSERATALNGCTHLRERIVARTLRRKLMIRRFLYLDDAQLVAVRIENVEK